MDQRRPRKGLPAGLLCVACLAFGVAPGAATDGDLDPTFDDTGWRYIFFDAGGNFHDEAHDLAIDASGRIFLTGWADSNDGVWDADFAVARLTASGALDSTFDGDGRVLVPFNFPVGSKRDWAYASAFDGSRLVTAGEVEHSGTNFDLGIARLNANGTLDSTFDGDGRQTVAYDVPATPQVDSAHDVAIDTAGRIVVVGGMTNFNGSVAHGDFAFARLDASGNPDGGFASGGKGWYGFDIGSGGLNDAAGALALDRQDRPILVGQAEFSGLDTDFAILRLLSNGNLDASFGSGGSRTIPFDLPGGPFSDRATAAALQRDGKIVVAGTASAATDEMAVIRLHPDGDLDAGFGNSGKVVVSFSEVPVSHDRVNAVALAPDGKIVIAGEAPNASGERRFALVRLTAAGALDPTFGNGGRLLLSFAAGTNHPEIARALLFQPDGRLLVAGGCHRGIGGDLDYDFCIARLQMSVIFADDFESGALWPWSSAFGGV